MRSKVHHLFWWGATLAAITLAVIIGAERIGSDWRFGELDLWLVLDRMTILFAYLMATLTVYTGFVAVRDDWFGRISLSRRHEISKESQEIEKNCDTLIMLYYKNADLAMKSLGCIKPKYLVLVCTDFAACTELEKRVQGMKSGPQVLPRHYVNNSGSATKTREQVASAIHQVLALGHSPERMVIDITGTTKPMTIGAFEAAEKAGIAVIYIKTDRDSSGDPIDSKPDALYVRKYKQD